MNRLHLPCDQVTIQPVNDISLHQVMPHVNQQGQFLWSSDSALVTRAQKALRLLEAQHAVAHAPKPLQIPVSLPQPLAPAV